MTNKTINFIGCGKLGQTIGKLFGKHEVGIVAGILNSSMENAEKAVALMGHGTAYPSLKHLPVADIYFITTPDDGIESIVYDLVSNQLLKKGAIVVHCSGVLSSDVLAKVKTQGCDAISIHPIKSFANLDQSVATFAGTYCAIEGDPSAIPTITTLFEKIGGIVFEINKENKKLYHAAGVMANNYLVTLHYHALQCYLQAGVDETVSKKIVSMLMNDALKNVQTFSHQSALTGPIQRGDLHTIKDHLTAFKNTAITPETKEIYTSLGLGTLTLTNHPENKKEVFKKILMAPAPLKPL